MRLAIPSGPLHSGDDKLAAGIGFAVGHWWRCYPSRESTRVQNWIILRVTFAEVAEPVAVTGGAPFVLPAEFAPLDWLVGVGSTGPPGGKREDLLAMTTKSAARSATDHVMRGVLGGIGGRKH